MSVFFTAPFMQGCGVGAGLIIAIGAQNAFVLKQGITKNHVFVTALTCALADTLLIGVGVGGFGKVILLSPLLLNVARWGGVVFLLCYGACAFHSAFQTTTVAAVEGSERPPLRQVILTILTVTFLNPHAYLDAMVVLGCIGAQFPEHGPFFFAAGAVSASFVWFFALSYGARYLEPFFRNPFAWKVLDLLVGVIMWGIAIRLAFWPLMGVPLCS